MANRASYNSSSDEDFVPSEGEDRPSTRNQKTACKRRRKQPERSSKQVKLRLFRNATASMYQPPAKRRRVETRGGPRSQVLPKETLLDVFRCEDRETLECLQLVCGRFDRIVYTKMNGVCLRPIYSVRLLHSSSYFYAQIFPVLRGSRPYKRLRPAPGIVYHANSIELATEWLFAGLRCAQVCKSFELQNVALSKHFLTQLKEAAPIFNVSGQLNLLDVSFLEDVTLATLISGFPGLSDVHMDLEDVPGKHVDDALLRCYAKKGLWKKFPQRDKGVDDFITEKGILDFCFGYTEQASGTVRDLQLRKPTVTKKFVANLVKACQSCGHNDPIRLELADIPKPNLSIFNGSKQSTDADGSFTAVVPGDKAFHVSYYATENTWIVHRGLE